MNWFNTRCEIVYKNSFGDLLWHRIVIDTVILNASIAGLIFWALFK